MHLWSMKWDHSKKRSLALFTSTCSSGNNRVPQTKEFVNNRNESPTGLETGICKIKTSAGSMAASNLFPGSWTGIFWLHPQKIEEKENSLGSFIL